MIYSQIAIVLISWVTDVFLPYDEQWLGALKGNLPLVEQVKNPRPRRLGFRNTTRLTSNHSKQPMTFWNCLLRTVTNCIDYPQPPSTTFLVARSLICLLHHPLLPENRVFVPNSHRQNTEICERRESLRLKSDKSQRGILLSRAHPPASSRQP
jgi:hypothetical protein